MEYPQVVSLVPKGEEFDATAVNEGVWVSTAHLANVENTLVANATSIADLNSQVIKTNDERDEANTSLQTAQQTITDRDATIALLKTEIADLKIKPAADPKQTNKESDKLDSGKQVPTSEITKEAERLRALKNKK